MASTSARHCLHRSRWPSTAMSICSPRASRVRSSGSGCCTIHLPEFAQMNEGPPNVALDGADGYTGGRGDLRMAQIPVESESQDHSLLVGQAIEFVSDHHPIDHPVGGLPVSY